MNRRFDAIVRRYIAPVAAGTQDVQDTAEQSAGVTSGPVDVQLRWRKVFPDNLPEIIVDFPESHASSII